MAETEKPNDATTPETPPATTDEAPRPTPEAPPEGGTALAPPPKTAPAAPAPRVEVIAGDRPLALIPRTIEELAKFATFIVDGGLAPDRYFGEKKGGQFIPYPRETTIKRVMAAIQLGAEIGLLPSMAVRNVALINGTPSIFGDAGLALVKASPLCEAVDEEEIGSLGTDGYGWRCTAKRKGKKAVVRTFTIADAKRGGILDKNPVWKNYPQRMAMFRARSWALRDQFPDVLMGLVFADRETETLVDESERTIDVEAVPAGTPGPAAKMLEAKAAAVGAPPSPEAAPAAGAPLPEPTPAPATAPKKSGLLG